MSSDKFLNINLKNLLKRSDFYNYFRKYHYDTKEERKELLNKLVSNVNVPDYKFEHIISTEINNKRVFYIEKPKKNTSESSLLKIMQEDFLIRIVNSYINNIYKVNQADRFKIIKVIINILSSNCSFNIIKCDIKQFYESINVATLFEKIDNSIIIPYEIKYLLHCIYNTVNKHNTINGLPRGLSISATLSELYMEKVDQEIKQMDGVFFYARYVDDIIIFTTNDIKFIMTQLKSMLTSIGLTLNNKTEFNTIEKIDFTYLGYHFFKENTYRITNKDKTKQNTIHQINISISKKKLNKIKRKIILTFLDYKHNLDKRLLLDRLKFLSSNYPLYLGNHIIKEYSSNKSLYSGLSYNYALINNLSCILELDLFVSRILSDVHFSKINKLIQIDLEKKILDISFYKNFLTRKKIKLTNNEFEKIIRCWRYDSEKKNV